MRRLQFGLRLRLALGLGIGCGLEFNSSNLLRLTAQLFRHPVARRRGEEKEEKSELARQLKRGAANTKHLVGCGRRRSERVWQSIDIDVCQTKNYSGLPRQGNPVERQAHGERDRPAQWALKLTFIAAVDVDFACLCLSLAAPTPLLHG